MGVRNYKNVPRVYFDMDGVLTNFQEALNNSNLAVQKFKLQPTTYLDLPIKKGAMEAVFKIYIRGFDIFVLSKIPRSNPRAAYEKIVWLNKNFPIFHDHIIISPDKGAIGKKQDFLIDDHPEWANAQNFLGTILYFKNNWEEILEKLPTRVEAL